MRSVHSLLLMTICSIFIFIFSPIHCRAIWFQVPPSVPDKKAQDTSNQASASVLLAIGTAQSAFRAIDDRNFKAAGELGMKATDEFGEAAGKINALTRYLQRSRVVRERLDGLLHKLDYAQRRELLDVPKGDVPLWTRVEELAKEQASIGLYSEAARRIESLREHSHAFFAPIHERGEDGYKPTQAARLLREIGEDLEFGAYGSGLFLTD